MKIYCRIAQEENTKEVHRANFCIDFREIVTIEEFFNEEWSSEPMTMVNDFYILEHSFEEIHADWTNFKRTLPERCN